LFDGRSELGEKRRRLLERSWAEVFRNHLLEDLPVDELFPYFDGAVKSGCQSVRDNYFRSFR
jgi:hypothetical protein